MARMPVLTFDRGTLVLHPPPRGKAWVDFATWDDRVEKFRIPAMQYRSLVGALKNAGTQIEDKAKAFSVQPFEKTGTREPLAHQAEALAAWVRQGRRGIVELPTGSGKTYLAQLAMRTTPRDTLVLVPTLVLMHQWYAELKQNFVGVEVGLLGGGSSDRSPILIATYDSAAIHAEALGNRYGLLVFDECHHLPSGFYKSIAEYSLAPYRLGLTATLERSDEKHHDLDELIGPLVYSKKPEQLAGGALAEHRIQQIRVELTADERKRYDDLRAVRDRFLSDNNIYLGTLKGWQRFVMASARSQEGRAAMLAHREARTLAFGTEAKLRVLKELLVQHTNDRLLIFTDDNATVYRVSQALLIPAITHQTKVKERDETLQRFRRGEYARVITSKVLNEGIDVPEANVAVVLSGTGSMREHVQRLGRILRKGEGKLALLYEVVAADTSEEGTSRRRRGEYQTKPQISRRPKPESKPLFEAIEDDTPLSFEDL
jgi:superfamily II DNA or RNA helicase